MKNLLIKVAAVASLALPAVTASAASWSYPNYGTYDHEGEYPNGNHACGGGFGWSQPVPEKKLAFAGRTYTIRLCYSDNYGAYARLDGAAKNDTRCVAVLHRSNTASTGNYASVWESVDGNVTYAYTKVGNNLEGRLARAEMVCDGGKPSQKIVRTAWY